MTNITITRSIPAPADQVWGVLKTFRLDYFPGYPHTVTGAGAGAERAFSLPDGEMIERIASFDDPGMTLTYEIVSSPWPVSDYLATVRVEPAGDGEAAVVSWSAEFEPDGVSEEQASELAAGTFKMNLKALEKYMAA
ncbi:MAG TPA: SRPBCC family protein [Anaerolineales bacterium]|nr:SRPBCC family protein [Anaerolineales bacterium]